MNHQTIILLEDDADRVRGFESAVAQLGPSYRLRAWRDTHRMTAECHEVLADVAKHLHDYREAIAATASVGGDVDTNCAIVGGVVALSTGRRGIPQDWLSEMERLSMPIF